MTTAGMFSSGNPNNQSIALPLMVIISMAVGIGYGIWWAAGVNEKIITIERGMERQNSSYIEIDKVVRQQTTEIIKLSFIMERISSDLQTLIRELEELTNDVTEFNTQAGEYIEEEH
jgi:hypothetical protein